MFTFIYYTIAVTLYVIAIVFLIPLSFIHKYKNAIPSRFFLFKNSKFKDNGIWFHACSLGETKALAPLIKNAKYPAKISVITNTGYDEALTNNAEVRYLPYEIFLPFWISRQKVLIVMEAELWYMVFFIAKLKGVKTYLINARINTNSYKKYLKNRWFYSRLFKYVDYILAQSIDDKKRLESLGASNVKVVGNIKLATKVTSTKHYIKPQKLVITAGSTHPKEETLILKAFNKMQDTNKQLIIAPRHPQRFDEVKKEITSFIKEKNYTFSIFSDKQSFNTDIILIDTLGELINIFAISDIVILGGSFEPIGGHNPIEPATFGCKIITGKYIFNQLSLFELVDNYKIVANSELSTMLYNHKDIKSSVINRDFNIDIINSSLSKYIIPLS